LRREGIMKQTAGAADVIYGISRVTESVIDDVIKT
jgi:hypothetical protein